MSADFVAQCMRIHRFPSCDISDDLPLIVLPDVAVVRLHKLKRLVQSPNSFFMDVKCPGCYQMYVQCINPSVVLLERRLVEFALGIVLGVVCGSV